MEICECCGKEVEDDFLYDCENCCNIVCEECIDYVCVFEGNLYEPPEYEKICYDCRNPTY